MYVCNESGFIMKSPKFEIGQLVAVQHHMANFTGIIYKRVLVDDMYEYWVTNAPEIMPGFPLLLWEDELT